MVKLLPRHHIDHHLFDMFPLFYQIRFPLRSLAFASYQLKIPPDTKCRCDAVAFAAVTLHAEVGEEAATALRLERDPSLLSDFLLKSAVIFRSNVIAGSEGLPVPINDRPRVIDFASASTVRILYWTE